MATNIMSSHGEAIKTEEQKDLQVVYLPGIECRCGECNLNDGDNIYICKNDQCISEYYCEDCGPFMHRSKSKKNHTFDINSNNVVLITNWLQKEENSDKFKYGENQLKSLVGAERYNKIKPYIEKPMSLALSNIPMAIMLAHELFDFFESASAAVNAANAVGNAHKAKQLINTAVVVTRALSESFPQLETINWITSAINTLANDNYEKALSLEKMRAVQATEALTKTMSANDVIKAGVIGMGIATCIEMCILGYRYQKDEISGKEWVRLVGKACARNSVSLVGTAVGGKLGAVTGCKIGAAMGTAINPVFGTVLGGTIGVFMGIVSGYLLGKGAETIYENAFPQNEKEEKTKKQLVKEALIYFHIQENDINNKNIFNEKLLKKLFHQFALNAHPDRKNGDYTEWYRLSTHYGVLKALVEQNSSNKEIVKNAINSLK
eukprot:539947_1